MISISKVANKNYLCKVVKLENLKKHSNADRLQVATIDFQDVITGMDAKEGDVYVYFPVECKINNSFLSFTNSFRNKELNESKDKAGFFEENCRVKAVKLRGEKSMGYIVPSQEVSAWANYQFKVEDIGKEFDTINDRKIVEKYFIKQPQSKKVKEGKKPKLSRLIDGQVHLHIDTENLRKNVDKLKLTDTISITYKTHGTSWWVSNVLVKKSMSIINKVLNFFKLDYVDSKYDIIYGSRRVVKNQYEDNDKAKDHYFGYDLWEHIKDEVKDKIPKGYTLYGECLGYTKDGAYIQKNYDYGCPVGKFKLEIYRITNTNSDGLVTELSYPQIEEFCYKVGLTPSKLFFYGTIEKFIGQQKYDPKYHSLIKQGDPIWREYFIHVLEAEYNEKDCFMCANKVPEEGIVVRKESLFHCEAYKLKSFRFLEQETKQLDKGESSLEEEN